jgi:restriction system protein
MAIPDFQTIMLPLLQFASDQQEHSFRNAIETLAERYALTNDERRKMSPSGRARVFDNRVGWARTHLVKSCLLAATRRGFFRITQRGLNVLSQNPERIDMAFLRQYPEYLPFHKRKITTMRHLMRQNCPKCKRRKKFSKLLTNKFVRI